MLVPSKFELLASLVESSDSFDRCECGNKNVIIGILSRLNDVMPSAGPNSDEPEVRLADELFDFIAGGFVAEGFFDKWHSETVA